MENLKNKKLGDLVDEMIQMAIKKSQGIKVEMGAYEMYQLEINKRFEEVYKRSHSHFDKLLS